MFFWSFSKLLMMSLVEGPISPATLRCSQPSVATQFWQYSKSPGHTPTIPARTQGTLKLKNISLYSYRKQNAAIVVKNRKPRNKI